MLNESTESATANAEQTAPHSESIEPATKVREKADRSTIGFPYVHLEETLTVSQAIFNHGGVPCSRDQLAVAMGSAPGSGGFSLKLGAAKMFGLVDNPDGRYILTVLGSDASSSDDMAAKAARACAFLKIPLYRRVYDEFKGRPLPPRPRGLETAFISFGVAPKQADKARQAFERSAQFAGFFSGGKDRLVEPLIGLSTQSNGKPPLEPIGERMQSPTTGMQHQTPKDPTKEPLIHGLLIRMPEPGTEWPHAKRVQWLQILASNLEMVYSSPDRTDDSMAVITVKLDAL